MIFLQEPPLSNVVLLAMPCRSRPINAAAHCTLYKTQRSWSSGVPV